MEYAYKMFNKDLTCTSGRGRFQYKEGKWFEEPEANCVRNGFHCAKNPLDCLSYYPNWEESVCYLVMIDGDIDEDATDSKISCTRIKLEKKLTLKQFVKAALLYIMQHPEMPENHHVKRDAATPGRNHFCIARGQDPKAKGEFGDVLGMLKEDPESGGIALARVIMIDSEKYMPGTWYDIKGRVRDA